MTNAEYRREKKKIRVPLFFKRKVFIVSMLLICSGIMAVMATYAWFILSTAPEVKGVSTTVGANGSLEIALLDNTTGANTSLIKADVGDSIEIVGRVWGNVTWGNLVDLSDVSYGLNTLTLYPSLLNETNDIINTGAMLSIAHNGYDGRITKVSSDTSAAKYNGTAFDTKDALYGVRAIGSVGSGSSRSGYLASAKSGFSSSLTSARSAANNAVMSNGGVLMGIAATGSSGTFSVAQVKALLAMTEGLKNSLTYSLTSYRQAIIATAAASQISDSDFEAVRAGVASATGNDFSKYANYYPTGMSAADVNTLGDQIAKADVAIDLANNLLYENYGTEDQEPVADTKTYTSSDISGIIGKIISNLSGLNEALSDTVLTIDSAQFPGLLTTAADYAGSYSSSIAGFTLKVESNENSGGGKLAAISLDGLTVSEDTSKTSTANTTVADFYGYVVDLAFRTNVSGSSLQLQTAAIDRVYTDGAGATKGEGSTVIYSFTENVSETQIRTLFSSIRVVFFNPDTGAIYAKARLGEGTINENTATAGLYLIDSNGQLSGDQAAITTLTQSTPQKVSALVYLDGSAFNNAAVINAKDSGSILVNLQFSSSAELIPMVDNELKNQTTVPAIPNSAPASSTETEQDEDTVTG